MSEKQAWGVIFADIRKGHAVTESGVKFTFTPGASLHQFLKEAARYTPLNRVYLCGELPGDYVSWLTSSEMYKHFRTQKIGHMLDGQNTDDYVARYEHRVTGRKLDVRSIERWLSTGNCTVFEARSAMILLCQSLKGEFVLFKHLAGTPSTTFSVLWKQYNALNNKHFAPLPDALREVIHQRGQGRIEHFTSNCLDDAGRARKLPGLYYYDGIFMYADLCRELPTEVETHDTQNIFAGKQFARYRIAFTVPANWKHLGPFGVRLDNVWQYPGAECAGQQYETWVEGSELDALVSFYTPATALDKKTAYEQATIAAFAQWHITIQERIVYKSAKNSAVKDPINAIIKKLVALRAKVEEDMRQDPTHEPVYKLVRAALRNLALHGIGAFHRQSRTRTYIALASEVPPVGFIDRNELDDGRIIYILAEDASASDMSHPEWSECVWGRCRARMFKHAISQPYSALITIRTDAIAVTHPVPAWEANTDIGKMRRKWAEEKPLKAPATALEFDVLQRKITGKNK